jgi:polysaccharide deacetylase 2 family uncharacterized protein YibQ
MSMNRRAVLAGLLGASALVRPGRADEPADALSLSSLPSLLPPPPEVSLLGALPRWQQFAVRVPPADGRPAISIVIDDMGVMHPGTPRAIGLPGPLTLCWFPFARELPRQVGAGQQHGHEALLHMPMQAFGNSIAWTGPDPLRIDLPAEENLRRLTAAMDAVPATVGLNNHMGSVATRDVALMSLVAQETKRRGMLFLDSLTIDHSVAYREAAQAGVPAAERDVFLDDIADRAAIAKQLELTERIARRYGHVIAIGHPRMLTLDALEEWLPGLQDRGFALWPLSATVAWRNDIAIPVG